MSGVSGELFSLSGATPLGAWGQGSGLLDGRGEAAASFRRGIKLGAEIDIQGRLEGKVGDTLAATLKAGLDVRVGALIQAQLPLDLFTEAGLIARAELDAAASAYAALALSLRPSELERLMGAQQSGLVGDLTDILLDELQLSAGLWARASFAAELMGRAALALSLIGDSPGFTFTFEGGVALAFGSGVSAVVNGGLPDPDRLMNRLGERIASTVVALIPTETDAERRAHAVAKVLLPGLIGSCVGLGRQLATSRSSATARSNAGGVLMASTLANSLDVVLRAAVDAGLDTVRSLLKGSTLLENIVDVPDKDEALDAVEALRGALAHLDGADAGVPAQWVGALLDCVGAVDRLITLPGLSPALAVSINPEVALVWAAAALVEKVMTHASVQGTAATSLLDGAPEHDPGPALREIYGGSVTYRRLAGFLADTLDDRLAEIPELAPAMALVGRLIGHDTGIIAALIDLAGRPAASAADVALHLVERTVASALKDDLLPVLHDAVAQELPATQAFVDDLVEPVLTALANVMPTVLASLESADERMRAREALSSVVLTALGDAIVALARAVLGHAVTNAAPAADQVAAEIRQQGTSSAAYQQVAAAGQGNAVAPDTAAGVFDHVGTLCEQTSDSDMLPLIRAIANGIGGGVGLAGNDGVRAVEVILRSEAPPNNDVLGDVVGQAADRGVAYAGALLAALFAKISDAVEQLVGVIVEAVKAAAAAVLHALEDGIAWAQKTIAELEKRTAELEHDAERFFAQVLAAAAALADALRRASDRFFDVLIDQVAATLERTLPAFITNWLVPIVRGLLRGLNEIADELMSIAEGLARSLSARLRAAAEAGQLTEAMFDDHVSAVAYAAPRHDIHLDVSNGIGLIPVTVDAGLIAGSALSTLRGDPSYAPQRATAVSATAGYASARSARSQTIAARDSAQAAAGMADRVAALRTGRPLSVVIEAPDTTGVHPSRTEARIRVSGGNRSFVEPQVSFGMPRRIRIFLNDQELLVRSGEWVDDGQDLVWTASLLAVVPDVWPTPIPHKHLSRRLRTSAPARTGARAETGQRRDPSAGESDDVLVTVSTLSRAPVRRLPVPESSVPVPAAVPRARHDVYALNGMVPRLLAAHPGVNTLAVAVADGRQEQASAHSVFTLLSPSNEQPPIRIASVVWAAPGGEHVVLENAGPDAVDLTGWTLRDLARHRLVLPGVKLPPGDGSMSSPQLAATTPATSISVAAARCGTTQETPPS